MGVMLALPSAELRMLPLSNMLTLQGGHTGSSGMYTLVRGFLCSFSTLHVTPISAVTAYVQHVALAEMLCQNIAIYCLVIG